MEVKNTSSPASQSKILSKSEVEAKLAKKFGDKALPDKEKIKSEESKTSPDVKVEIDPKTQDKQLKKEELVKVVEKEDVVIGDVGKNDPKDVVTQEKLKSLLQTGAFNFSDKERQTLSEILKP